MLTKLEQAKANKETLKVSYTTVLFSGSSGVGKSTFVNKLNKEQLNTHHHSTGVAKSKHTICIKTAAVIKSAEGLQWTNFDHDSMISYLNKHLRSLRFTPLTPHAASSTPEQKSTPSDLNKKTLDQKFPLLHLTAASPPKDNIPNITRNKGAVKMNNEDAVDSVEADVITVDIAKADSSNTPSLGEVWDIINFLDTGGQPEFVNILPAVSSSIALTFIVFNLSNSLDDLVHVQHNVHGDPSFAPYHLDCTNAEFIKRLLVSSENFNKNITPLKIESIQREDGGNDSKICYIGTHALNVSEEKIKEIDDRLSSIANDLELQERSFWCSPKPELKRLYPVDMFPDDDKESFEDVIEDIRDNIQKQVQGRDYYEVPITWFIFLLKIQKLCSEKSISYISYQEAVDVWMDENKLEAKSDQGSHDDQQDIASRDNSDVHIILLFFHFMGMLFYYHEVKGICDFVFIDRQWLFQKLTELVQIKFTKGYNKKDVRAQDVEKFTTQGRLSVNIIRNLKIDLQGIEPLYFIHLLDYLNIVALIDSKKKEYFMPSVLPSIPIATSAHKFFGLEKFYDAIRFIPSVLPIIPIARFAHRFIDLEKHYGAIQHVPLLVGFKNGPMPHGFFCHLIVELFRNLPVDWNLPLRPTQGVQHVYNNFITFPTTSGHAVSLFYKIGYLEVQVRHKHHQPTSIHCDVQTELEKSLRKVSGHLQVQKDQLCYGFYCQCKQFQHFAKLKEITSPTEYISCGYSNTKLAEDHRVWLQVELFIISYIRIH